MQRLSLKQEVLPTPPSPPPKKKWAMCSVVYISRVMYKDLWHFRFNKIFLTLVFFFSSVTGGNHRNIKSELSLQVFEYFYFET